MWPWHARADVKNDFFQLSTPDCLALGSMGHFALYIDQELLHVGEACVRILVRKGVSDVMMQVDVLVVPGLSDECMRI